MAVGDYTELRNGAWVPIGVPVNPPPPGVITMYGSSWGGASDEAGPSSASFARIAATFGGLKVARYFPPDGSAPAWTSFPQYLRDSGAAVIASFRIPPAQVVDNSNNAAIQAMFASFPTDREIWLSYYHEVDADTVLNASSPPFTLAEFWAAHQHIRALKDLYAPPNVHLTLILTSQPFIPSRLPPHPYGYYWDNSFEAIGADLYQHGTTSANLDSASTVCAGALEAIGTLGVPLIVPELGVRNITYQTDAARALWLSQVIGLLDTKASAVSYYESYRGSLGPWNITEEPLDTVYSSQAKVVWSQAVSKTNGGTMPYGTPIPPPPAPSGMTIGNSAAQFDTFQTIVNNPTGAKGPGVNTGFSMRRSYESGWPTLFGASDAAADPGRGVMSHWSYTPGATWFTTLLTSTTIQNQIRDFFNSWPAAHGGLISFGHEPENNGYDLADYRAGQRLIYQIFLASNIDKTRVKYVIVLTNEPYRSGIAKQYYPQLASGAVDFSAFDAAGCDYYRYLRPSVAPLDPTLGTRGQQHPITYWADPVITFAQGHPIVIAEHGSHPDPNNLQQRPTLFQGDLDYWKANGCIAFEIYHSKLQTGHGPWWWHVLHCYPMLAANWDGNGHPGNLGTGASPWNNNDPDDQTHADTAMLDKVRTVLAAAPRYNSATFTGW